MPKPEWKILPLIEAKVSGDGNGSFSGYASSFGNTDSYNDTIIPGAYTAYLSKFVDNGFIAWSHDWEQMIGTVASAKEDRTGLYITADFHSTPTAQEARTIAAERIARGKSMGLSIGYLAHKWSYKDAGAGQDQIRVLEEIEVFETSLVAMPADSYAGVTGIKSHPLTERPSKSWLIPGFKSDEPAIDPPATEPAPDPDESSDPEATERFAEQGERVLLDLTAFAGRAADLSALRQKSGRVLSEANRNRLAGLIDQLDTLRSQMGDLLSSAEPLPPVDDPAKSALSDELARSFARLDSIAAVYAAESIHSLAR